MTSDSISHLIAEKDREIAALRAELVEVQSKFDYLMKKVFAPSSEKRPVPDTIGIQESIFGVPVQQEPAPPETITIPSHDRTKKKGHGRTEVSPELPTREVIIEATPAEKVDHDGTPLTLMGYETSSKINVVPGIIEHVIIKRERWGRADTHETIHTAAVPPCLIPKGKATDSFLHEIIINKFHLGLPLYRQLMDLNHRGAQLSTSFLGDCVSQAAERYRPIWEALRAQIFAHRVVNADETPIRQLIPKAEAPSDQPERRVRTGYFWAWLAGGQCYLHYGTTRSQAEVREVLNIPDEGEWDPGGLIAYLVIDGYSGYNPAFAVHPDRPARIRRAACWAHVRRRFLQCADRGDTNASQLVALISELFRIDRATRKENEKEDRTGQAAHAYRLTRRLRDSAPLVASILTRIDQLVPLYTASRDMAKHLAYTLNLWNALTVFLEDGEIPVDNNAAERALRSVVIGRKNWMFVGSEDAGQWAAIFFSLMESCRQLHIDPRKYLAYVTPRLLEASPPDPSSLTPASLASTLATRNS